MASYWWEEGNLWFEVLLENQNSFPVSRFHFSTTPSRSERCLLKVVSFHLNEWIVHRCLEFLLQNDANPSIQDKEGYNTVHYAAAYGHRQCLELVSAQTAWRSLNCWYMCMCKYYQLPWWLLSQFFGYSQICENLQFGAVNSNIRNQLYLKNSPCSTSWCLSLVFDWCLCVHKLFLTVIKIFSVYVCGPAVRESS